MNCINIWRVDSQYLFTDNPPSPPEKWARNQDDQVPNRIYVYNDLIFGEKQIGGTDFVFIKTDIKRLGSTKSLKAPDGIDAVMVTKTRALVDAVYDWSRYNTLLRTYGWIAETLKKSVHRRESDL